LWRIIIKEDILKSMKNKIHKIFGVALTVVLVASMFVFAVPIPVAAQAYTPNQWNAMVIPGWAGQVITGTGNPTLGKTNITDFAVGSDGTTIYAVGTGTVANFIAKSTNGGKTWSVLGNPTTFTGPARLVAVAPDNPAVVAVVDSADGVAYSTNGGAIWNDLGDPTLGAADVCQDIAISPARYDALLGRDMLVATSNPGSLAATTDTVRISTAVADNGTITVTFGSLRATPSALVNAGFGVGTAGTINVASGAVAWTGAAAAGTIDLAALTPNTIFTWTRVGVSTAATTIDADADMGAIGTNVPAGAPWTLPDVVGFGNLYLVGGNLTWTPVGIALTYDYTSCTFEPNWVGGRSVVAVGSSATNTFVQVRQIVPPAPPFSVANAGMVVFGVTFPVEYGAAGGILSSSLALPSDFDSTSGSARVAYVGLNSGAAFDDVYRMNSIGPTASTYKLGISAADVGIQSIAFSGDRTGGTLAAGESASTSVWVSKDPQLSLPTWSWSPKGPTGATLTIVALAPDYATATLKTVYAGTTGSESAFSRSTNGGSTFNQLSLIDTTLITLDDVMPAPDNSVVFLSSTNNGADPALDASLWRSSTPPALGTWERVRLRGTAAVPQGGFIIRLSPDYVTDKTLYWCDLGATDIQKSTNGGELFASRTAPIGMVDVTVESKEVLYMANGTFVYKSINGAWFFGLPIPTQTSGVYSLAMAPTYPEKPKAGNVLVGGIAGEVSLSTDAGASFIPLLSSVATGNMSVAADKDYATNNMVYAASRAPNEGIYRYTVGTSTAWENIRVVPNPLAVNIRMTGLATQGGALYGLWYNWGAGIGGVERSLAPTLPDIVAGTFDTMDAPVFNPLTSGTNARFNLAPSALRAGATVTDVWLWAIDTGATAVGPRLMAYDDTMAKAVVTVTVPATVMNDPTTGRNAAFVITWTKPSNATTYNAGIYTNADCTQLVGWATNVLLGGAGAYVPPNPLVPSWSVPPGVISSGVKYYVRVFATNQAPNDWIRSPFIPSAIKVVSFTVEAGTPVQMPSVGPTLLSPTPGDMAVPVRPGFAWTPMPGATTYQFILATDQALTKTVGGTPALVTSPNFGLSADLAYDTTYWYAVKVTVPTSSPQSIGSFHTMATPKAEVFTCPIDGLTFTTRAALEAHIAAAHAPVKPVTPAYIWAIVIIGAVLVITVIVLIVTTRRVP